MRTNKQLITVLAVCLAVLLLPTAALAAFSESLLENPVYSLQANVLSYAEQEFEEGGQQKLFYGEYNAADPNAEYEWVIHSIRKGTKTTLTTVMDIAKDYEENTGRKVMLAANGDYFDFGSGSNMESYVNDGIVISKGAFATKHCIGFDNAGKVVIGRMTEVERRLMIVLNGQRHFFHIDAYNEDPGENGIAIYSAPGTYTVTGAGKYVCVTDSTNLNQYPVFGTSRRMTIGTALNDDAFTLKSGQFAVVVRGENAQFFYDSIQYGVEVDLVEIPAGEFADCTWVLGGYDILVDDGVVNTKCHTDNSGNAKAPRTFIGFKADGTAFLCVVDGRQSGYSVGITVSKEAELAKALGAQFALELDGGGSSTMIVRIDDTLTLRNQPSDGAMRRVSNAILLVEKVKEEPEPPSQTEPETTSATTPSATAPATAPSTGTHAPVTPAPSASTAVIVIAIGAVLVAGIVVARIIRKRKTAS